MNAASRWVVCMECYHLWDDETHDDQHSWQRPCGCIDERGSRTVMHLPGDSLAELEARAAEADELRRALGKANQAVHERCVERDALRRDALAFDNVRDALDHAHEEIDALRAEKERWRGEYNEQVQRWSDAQARVQRLQEALERAHAWLERVDQNPGYFGLDHKIGENVEGCTMCAAVSERSDDTAETT
jgi:chromosome segregation ATPase